MHTKGSVNWLHVVSRCSLLININDKYFLLENEMKKLYHNLHYRNLAPFSDMKTSTRKMRFEKRELILT